MTTLTLDPKLAERLYAAARRQGRSLEDCAHQAIRCWVEDWEQAMRLQAQLGGPNDGGVARPPEEFYD